MSDVRCRACGAAVPSEAQWCSLCFADLREPAPVRERVSVPAARTAADGLDQSVPPAHNDARPDPDVLLGLTEPPDTAATTDADSSSEVPFGTPAGPELEWPCLRCGARVLMSLDACPSCGAGFLAGATGSTSARLPLVGDVGRFSRNQRVALGFGLAILVMVVLVLLAFIGGQIF
jgi:hypothetical protein